MFTIYHSIQPENFKNVLINVMSNQPLSNPIQPEIIIIENGTMAVWIELELAKYFDISANVKFMNLVSFIQKMFCMIKSSDCVISDFNYSIMYWKFMEILPQISLVRNCSIIQKYLHNDFDQRKCGQFSEKLVRLFTQYLIYRPDWLDHWKSNKIINDITDSHQEWQLELWNTFLKNMECNNPTLYKSVDYLQRCIHLLENTQKIDNDNFPKRIFLCGIVSMPPIYWKILQLLSYKIDIYLWFISPYAKGSYDDVFNQDFLHFMTKNKIPFYETGKKLKSYFSAISNNIDVSNGVNRTLNHPLLKIYSNLGQDTLFALTYLKDFFEIKNFSIPKEDSLLHILQKDILEFQNYIVNFEKYNIKTLRNYQRYVLESDDQSITCHVCHSIQREVEVLHDNLLLMLQNNPSLLKKGVIVMAPNIYDYSAAIQTVFNNINNRNLPFIISSKYLSCDHPIVSTFLNILKISYNRCTSEEILSFLMTSLIADRFDITAEEIKLLHQWTIKSGVRWGLDNVTVNSFTMPITNQNTWFFGFYRMLLGYAINSQYGTWNNILPYDDIQEGHINIIGKLGEFLQTLRKWRDRLSCSLTLEKWMPYMKEIFNDFFCCSHIGTEDNKILSLLQDCWRDILEPGIQLEYSKAINVMVLHDRLCYRLNQTIRNYQFLPNIVNFCDITPICCIPCQVVCFLGMNDNAFPKNKIPFDFDLIKKYPRINDYNIYNKDCYSFLLALLLAKERIYISFIGNSMFEDISHDPSVVVCALFEYIAHSFYLIEDKNLDININFNRIRHHLYRWYNRVPFASEHFMPNSKTQSFADEWMLSANIHTNNTNNLFCSNFVVPLSQIMINEISFHDLYQFYRHPVKMWFQKRLGVHFPQNILTLINDESFSLDGLDRFILNTRLVDCLVHNNNLNQFYDNIRASGTLPYGAFGELYWIKQYQEMSILSNKIKLYYSSVKSNLDIFLKFSDTILTGQLIAVQDNGLVRWKPAYLSIKDGLLLWLEHVVYCSIGGTGDSWLFGTNDTWHFPNLPKLQTMEFLHLLISGYLMGINQPLLLLYKSGGAWIYQMFDQYTKTISSKISSQEKARCKLIHAWQGIKNFVIGEYQDPYFRMLIPYNLSEEKIEEIINISKYYLLFPMKYKINSC